MENEATIKPPIPTTSGFRNSALCSLIFAFSTYLSCHEFIATEPPFLSMDYFSVFSAFSVAISFVPPWLCGHESIMQNKPNFKMGNINISTSMITAYAKKQRTMNTKRYSKQTQSNPISDAEAVQWCEESHPTGLASRNIAPAPRTPGGEARAT
jgi:hypothetical protein